MIQEEISVHLHLLNFIIPGSVTVESTFFSAGYIRRFGSSPPLYRGRHFCAVRIFADDEMKLSYSVFCLVIYYQKVFQFFLLHYKWALGTFKEDWHVFLFFLLFCFIIFFIFFAGVNR